MKMLEKLCLWYLKKYWNSKAYKAEQARLLAEEAKKQPPLMMGKAEVLWEKS